MAKYPSWAADGEEVANRTSSNSRKTDPKMAWNKAVVKNGAGVQAETSRDLQCTTGNIELSQSLS